MQEGNRGGGGGGEGGWDLDAPQQVASSQGCGPGPWGHCRAPRSKSVWNPLSGAYEDRHSIKSKDVYTRSELHENPAPLQVILQYCLLVPGGSSVLPGGSGAASGAAGRGSRHPLGTVPCKPPSLPWEMLAALFTVLGLPSQLFSLSKCSLWGRPSRPGPRRAGGPAAPPGRPGRGRQVSGGFVRRRVGSTLGRGESSFHPLMPNSLWEEERIPRHTVRSRAGEPLGSD